MPSSLLLAINNEGRVYSLSTNNSRWREFIYLGLEFKHLSAVPHFLWAVGGDRQIYVHVHGLDIPIRIKEEAYENERWIPLEGFGGRLLPTDRYHFSSQDGLRDRSLDKIRLPSMAWQWEGDWHLDTTLDGQPLDHDGWTYAVDFPATFHAAKQWKSCVRRRKWLRYRRYSALNSWCAIAPLHRDATREPFIDVSVGGQNLPGGEVGHLLVWAVTAQGRVMLRAGVTATSPEGARWAAVPTPSGAEVRQVAVGAAGLVWAALWSGGALVRLGVTRDEPTGRAWVGVDAPADGLRLAQVSVGTDAVWATTADRRVWFRKGVRGEGAGTADELATGAGWVEMVGTMASVSVSANDQVFAVGCDDRRVFVRAGVGPAELTGRGWRALSVPAQLSRAGSIASLAPNNRRAAREKRVRSWGCAGGSLSQASPESSLPRDWETTARSAPGPGSLRAMPALWQRTTDGASLARLDGSDSGSEESLSAAEIGSIQEHCERSHPKAGSAGGSTTGSAWSPLRSAGSAVGMELHADSLINVHVDDGVFGEHDNESLTGDDTQLSWSLVEAGACCLDPSTLPRWFDDRPAPPGAVEVELARPWRVKILDELRRRPATGDGHDFAHYQQAVEMSSWIKSGGVQWRSSATSPWEDCILELEWVGATAADCGTLTVLSADRARSRAQFALTEVACVACVSEPGRPRIAVHTPRRDAEPRLTLQFKGDVDMEDWMANLTLVCCQVNGIRGAPSSRAIWSTTLLGDVFVFDAAPLAASQRNNGQLYSQELRCSNRSTPLTWPLLNGLAPGSGVIVRGTVAPNADRFAVNLRCGARGDIAMHFNPRFEAAIVVRNAFLLDTWGDEEREGNSVFARGADFAIDIECQEEGFRICVDGHLFTYFTHRAPPSGIAALEVTGDISIRGATYRSRELVVPPTDMFWRQMGGHLRLVETCARGVTWGVAFDGAAWAYTGGWGGSFLRGLEASADGVRAMTDRHACHVYENQRWNPLTGYTSHGLPTDRYMWSDVTGKLKRTREKTKLVSMHWQWTSEWETDFHAPGGVDKDGWQYAIDFPASFHGQKQATDFVRRRRWVRRCQLSTSGPWQEVGNTKLADVSLFSEPAIDGDENGVVVWAVAANGDAVFRRGVSPSCPTGTAWEHVPSDQPLCGISAGPGHQVWAVGRNGSAYWRFGITQTNPTGEVWQSVEPPSGRSLRQVSVGRWAVWGLDATGQLSVRREVTPVFPEGTHWHTLPPDPPPSTGFRCVSAGDSERAVWAVTGAGVVCHRYGVTEDDPAGVGWTQGIGGNWQYVSARGCVPSSSTST